MSNRLPGFVVPDRMPATSASGLLDLFFDDRFPDFLAVGDGSFFSVS
jgi:hypothetical protein